MIVKRGLARCVLLGLLCAAALGGGLRPAAALTGKEAGAKIEAEYGVQVLRVREGTIDGVAVWLITVMKPGSESNDAFQVTTLAVEQVTGRLVPVFRHGPSGPARLDGTFATTDEQRPSILRSGGTWR